MKPKYIKYGDEWRKEVMKHPKSVIVDMLRRVAIERDRLAKKRLSDKSKFYAKRIRH